MPKKPWSAGKTEVFCGEKLIRTVQFVYGATYSYEGKGQRRGQKCMLCFTFDFESVPVIWDSGESGIVPGEDLSYVQDPTPESYERSMTGVSPEVKRAIDLIKTRS